MKTQQYFWNYSWFVMMALLAVATGCKKEDKTEVPVLSTSEVTRFAQITAESGGIITSDGGLEITERGVCWSTSNNPTIADHKTSDSTGTGSFTSALTGLTAETTYYVRAYATNSKGTGYGNTIVFQTLGYLFTDPRDGNEYTIATIGNHLWMTENLKYLPDVVSASTGSITDPHHYVYDYVGSDVVEAKATANYATYGTIFNAPAAKDACPPGWHLPSHDEWAELIDLLGGTWEAGGKLKEAGTSHWESPNTDATNESGFTALPGGVRNFYYHNFVNIGRNGSWWSDTEDNAGHVWFLSCTYFWGGVYFQAGDKGAGLSVRCVRD